MGLRRVFHTPLAVTPDGRLWMAYEGGVFPNFRRGLCWYDGTNVGDFPAPPNGEPQWGGLPHAAIADLKVRIVADGYELWMSCLSRGIAVLSVSGAALCASDFNQDGGVDGGDVEAFFIAWEVSDSRADVNRDGGVPGADVEEFFIGWEAGC